ncbi:hypothetical protein BH11MYX2_BH11MYX2_05840 [soil metagenome]
MNLTSIECNRQIPAAPQDVWDVWTDPHHPGGPWFSPQGNGMSSKIILDKKVDGLFYHCVTRGDASWVHYGRFTQLEPGALVEHTWVCEATKGRESIVTTRFEATDGGTFVTITQTGIPDDEEGRAQDAGWQWTLGMPADVMSKRKQS